MDDLNNPENKWVQIFSVSSDDSWILCNLPRTPLVHVSPFNGTKSYVYRNSEPLPPDTCWWVDGGDGCVVLTSFLEPFEPLEGVPAFPLTSRQMLQEEPQFV